MPGRVEWRDPGRVDTREGGRTDALEAGRWWEAADKGRLGPLDKGLRIDAPEEELLSSWCGADALGRIDILVQEGWLRKA